MTSFVTQCPHCRTSFRVNPAQLGAAQGMVRCGACLQVFNAGRYLQADSGRDRPGRSLETLAPTAPAASIDPGRSADEEALDLDHIDLDAELARLERLEQARPASDTPEPPRQEPTLGALAHPDKTAQPGEAMPDSAADPVPLPAVRLTPVDEAAPLPPTPLAVSERPLRTAARHARTEHRIDPQAPERNEPSLSDAPVIDLEDEPLQLEWQPRPARWGRRFGWIGLNLLALLALGAQYVTYNFDELARQDAYRPWFERLCPTLGCSLPTRVDIAQIRSSNLVVRSHPDFAGALVVDAILYNRASFAQPFPLLELRFADLSGRLVASRQFKPSEYLAGELAGERDMPPQTPIHIALDILDPGEQAVNYSLNFRSPE